MTKKKVAEIKDQEVTKPLDNEVVEPKKGGRPKGVNYKKPEPKPTHDSKGNIIPVKGTIYMIIDPVVYTVFKAKMVGGSKHNYRFQTSGGDLIVRKINADIIHEYSDEAYMALNQIALEIKVNKYKFDQLVV